MNSARTYKRAYYRLRYPSSMRPRVRIDSVEYEVAELSERGMRIICGSNFDMKPETPIRGEMRFSDEQTSEIVGAMMRREKDEVVFSVSSGVSYKRMLEEQLHIVHKFPSYFSKPE